MPPPLLFFLEYGAWISWFLLLGNYKVQPAFKLAGCQAAFRHVVWLSECFQRHLFHSTLFLLFNVIRMSWFQNFRR
jgi:hypothetical protein